MGIGDEDLIAAVLLLIALSACTVTNGIDVIAPSALKEPIFVVAPSNGDDLQDDYAVTVENNLLESGIRVATRPTFKEVRIELDALETDVVSEAGAVAAGSAWLQEEGRVVESFLQMEESAANYRVNTYAGSETVEIVSRLERQVLAVFEFEDLGLSKRQIKRKRTLALRLRAIGFDIRDWKESPYDPVIVAAEAQPGPKFTVIPSTTFLDEVGYALHIQRILIRLGLYVVRPPTPHIRIESTGTTAAAAKSDGSETSGLLSSAKRVEIFWTYEETPANVIVKTKWRSQRTRTDRVKIIDKESGEILAVVKIKWGGSDSAASDRVAMKALRDTLSSVGIPVDLKLQ